jgi:cyclopropane-fatty-acyl-phospholipid synthase
MPRAKEIIHKLFLKKDIIINGKRDHDITIRNEKFYSRVLAEGSLALGESYMDGWWDSKRLDLFIARLTKGRLDDKVNLKAIVEYLKASLLNLQNKTKAKEVVDKHYDISDGKIFLSFLDEFNQYTCGYFNNAEDLEQAEKQKMALICKKLQLKSTDKVLDIGCGWGGLAKYIAENHGCKVTGISISDSQVKYAKKFTKNHNVIIKNLDYRDLNEKFDKIVSVEMFEHVGYKNYKIFMQIVHKCLNNKGLFLLQTIGQNKTTKKGNAWIDKYIFPNNMLPSIKQIGEATEELLVMEDWHNFGHYYYKTLMAWEKRFKENWHKFKDKKGYDKRFYKMMKFYFLFCAGIFKSRRVQLWQIVFTKGDIQEVYKSVR